MKMKQMLNKKILQKIIKRNKTKYVNGIDILHISLTGMTLQICQQYGLVQTTHEIPPKYLKITNIICSNFCHSAIISNTSVEYIALSQIEEKV